MHERRTERKHMEYMGTKEASEKWGYSQAVISKWCREGLVDKAEQDKKGSPWRIPINTECPKKNKIRKEQKNE